jgi:hypothetical protein
LSGKGGLHQVTLAMVQIAFTIQESFAKKLGTDVSSSGFDKGPVMRYQDIANSVRMGDKHNAFRP